MIYILLMKKIFTVLIIITSAIILAISYFFITEIEINFEVVELPETSGARCLDGSNYQFLLSKGFDSGKDKFLIFFEGGGWCGVEYSTEGWEHPEKTLKSCYHRSKMYLGSSKNTYLFRSTFSRYQRIFSAKPEYNPNFYNWNKIQLKYCDGMGFQGYKQEKQHISDTEWVYLRGYSNTVESLKYLIKNFNFTQADKVIVSGYSAGGLAALYCANYINNLSEKHENTYVISDSGLFLDYSDYSKKRGVFRKIMQNIVMHSGTLEPTNYPLLKSYCEEIYDTHDENSKKDTAWKCFTPQYFISKVQLPILFLNSLYDSWSLRNLVGLDCYFKSHSTIDNCNTEDILFSEKYSEALVNLARQHQAQHAPQTFWMPKAFLHTFLMFSNSWDNERYEVNGIGLSRIISDWYRNVTSSISVNRVIYDTNSDKITKHYLVDLYWYIYQLII